MRRTLRGRLTLLYGSVFFVSGMILLAFVFGLFWTGRSTRESTPVLDGRQVPDGAAIADRQHGHDLHTLLVSSGIALAVTGLASVALGWIIAGRALRPLLTMTTTAQAISASNLHSRIGLDSPYEEFKELGATLDELFERLDAAFQSQRHFVANASHELRTPLTVERALLQVALADPDASAESLRSTCEELLTLGAAQERLIESLLTLASSEQGVEEWEPLDLGVIAAEAVLVRRPEAERRGVRIDTVLARAPATGDGRLVESLVANLVDNAIQHNVADGHVSVTTSSSEHGARITVTNTGPVVPDDDMDRLFVPFQRLHTERTRHPDGHGLGLAIVRAITTTHRAVLTAKALESGGLDVRVTFPLHPPVGEPMARSGAERGARTDTPGT
ncbi:MULTISPECIES: sensor histidine kinase [unclassified Streptomyces]|jgi:signal transduction histidine kinase|uniref:sensor histidine kinase n=1 Tax=unclassified Streptomyces TaxID=2593676 RepID=UPI002E253E93